MRIELRKEERYFKSILNGISPRCSAEFTQDRKQPIFYAHHRLSLVPFDRGLHVRLSAHRKNAPPSLPTTLNNSLLWSEAMTFYLRGQVTCCAPNAVLSSAKKNRSLAQVPGIPCSSIHTKQLRSKPSQQLFCKPSASLAWVQTDAPRHSQQRQVGCKTFRGGRYYGALCSVAEEDSGSYTQTEEVKVIGSCQEVPTSTFSMVWSNQTDSSIAPMSSHGLQLQPLSQESAMGIVYQAATGSSTGWTTGSGLAGPTEIAGQLPPDRRGVWPPLLSKSPRRSAAVEFTCNKCGGRTQRAINPHAYTSGTVFVQCGQCQVFHKLVDHLKLFHELKGPIYGSAYGNPDVEYHKSYDPYHTEGSEPFPFY